MPDILHEVVIAASPDKVYKAITEQQELASWWTVHITTEPRVRALGEASFYNGQAVIKLQVAALEPASKVAWNIMAGMPDWVGTLVTWDLSPVEGGTQLLFGHRGFASVDGSFPKASYNWAAIHMTSLKAYLETGKGNPHLD